MDAPRLQSKLGVIVRAVRSLYCFLVLEVASSVLPDNSILFLGL